MQYDRTLDWQPEDTCLAPTLAGYMMTDKLLRVFGYQKGGGKKPGEFYTKIRENCN